VSLIREVGCWLVEPFVSMTAADYFTSTWEALLIWERGGVLRGLHGGCIEWVWSLCGGSELWLGSTMQLWRMAKASGRS